MLTLGGRLRFSADVFYEKIRNLQVQATRYDPATQGTEYYSTNAGHVTSQGAEVDFQARPVPALTLSGGIAYVHAYVDTTGLECPLVDQANALVSAATPQPLNVCFLPSATATTTDVNVEGGMLPDSPEWSGDLVARYEHVIPNTSLAGFIQASANYRSAVNFSLNQDPETVQGAY
ncbi:TonB-dependent receptor, partial [mine drainage metagenome]